MANFTNREYADMMFVYGKCEGNSRAAVREYRLRFPSRRIPNHQTFSAVFSCIAQYGRVPDRKKDRQRNLERSDEVLQLIQAQPSTSIRRVSAQLHLPKHKVHRIIKEENMYPYHIQQVQRLEPGDNVLSLNFAHWIANHRVTLYRTIFSDEAQFTRDGVFNIHNSHIWAENNPHSIRLRNSQHKFSVNVWCAVINKHLIGPHFFDGRLTSAIYLDFLQNILPGMLQGINIRGIYFQHDGAGPHFGLEVRSYLDNTYPNRWIGRGGPIPWPPRSPDFNPLDYFLWGKLKDMVYSEEIQSREQLMNRIINCCDILRNNGDMIRKAVSNLNIRQEKCIQANGFHFEPLLK